jgi:hypothetical protein
MRASILGVSFLAAMLPGTAVAVWQSQPSQQSSPPAAAAQDPSQAGPDSRAPHGSARPTEAARRPQASRQATAQSKPAARKPAAASSLTAQRPHQKPKPAKVDDPQSKIVVRNGSTAEPAVELSPSLSTSQASQERQTTAQLLAITDNNLKKIPVQSLNANQRDSMSEILNYVEQSKAALKTGDLQRAQNLAAKARLLSDDLAKP